MEDNRPRFVTSEQKQQLPVLIIDKKGSVGLPLARRLQKDFFIVLLAEKEVQAEENIIHIPYHNRLPAIPNNAYSHIFIIYEGEREIIDALSSFVKKAQQTNGEVFFILPLVQSNERLFRKLSHKNYHQMQIIVFGEVFDNVAANNSLISHFIQQARSSQRIEITSDGLAKHYPILLEDVVMAIIAKCFSGNIRQRVIYIFPRYPFTEFSIARIIQKVNPSIRLVFKKQKSSQKDFYIPEGGEYVSSQYDLEERLSKIDFSKNENENIYQQSGDKLIHKRHNGKFSGFLLMAIIGLLILPFLVAAGSLLTGMVAAEYSFQSGEKGNFQQALQLAVIAKRSFTLSETTIKNFPLFKVVLPTLQAQVVGKIMVGETLAETERSLFEGIVLLQAIYNGQNSNTTRSFDLALADIKNTLLLVQKMQIEGELPDQIATKLSDFDALFPLFEETITSAPYLFGFEGQKEYLILFQNNMELRPGGGFIGSYGLLTLDHGKSQFKLYDVYDADGKLKADIEPPFALKRYLGASHLFLRDSNFDVDFTNDAKQAAFLLQLETGEKVDGVIAIDTDFLKSMLSLQGSVYVMDYKQTVTPDNFYLLTQTHAEKNFFPGSTQKKDFLRALFDAMLLQFSEKKNVAAGSLLKRVGEAVKQKHLLFSFADPSVQQQFTANDLSSSLWESREQKKNTFLDSFGISEANIGLNKVNYYMKRSLQQKVIIADTGDVEETATVTYHNASSKSSTFGGDYKNYVRFILPANASLKSVTIDGQNVATVAAITDAAVYTKRTFLPPKGLEIEKSQEQGKALVGFLLTIPVNTTKTVSIIYLISHVIDMRASAFTYSLHLFKQSGSQADPYSFDVGYPALFKPTDNDVNLGNKRSFVDTLSEDKDIEIQFNRK